MNIINQMKQLFKKKEETNMKNILFIVGSLREGSFNHQMAKKAEDLLAGKANVTYLDYKDIPLMNQDLEIPTLPAVQAARDAVLAADAIWLFSPVYNFAIPGTVKNLIDWLSRALDLSETRGPSALQDKIVTVSSVANGGHEQLFGAYQALLPFVRMQVVGDFTGTTVNPEAWGTGELVLNEEAISGLEKQAQALLQA
ncbi:hypothetical protein SORDD15_01765 [Streptococcus oralis]|uniref:NADPH-dependent FMN reductase-like domain-containing protein n=2 Tax=Streptococcus oralis TaxID=1303 RepID=A0A139NVT3_STROR|nr:hypothetical protein SORDD15_01765 [Streptococcus oralis]